MHTKNRLCLIFPCRDVLLGSLSGKQEASGFVLASAWNQGILSSHNSPQHPVWARERGGRCCTHLHTEQGCKSIGTTS